MEFCIGAFTTVLGILVGGGMTWFSTVRHDRLVRVLEMAPRTAWHRIGRPAGGGGQIGECLGHSRGGFTIKIHLVADGRCRPLAFVLTPGRHGDGPQLERVLGQLSVPHSGAGRPRTRPDHVLADKAYTSRKNRRYLRRRGIRHTIPERRDQQKHRQNRGSRGGRPTGFDGKHYKKRNTVERAINRLKGFRAVAALAIGLRT